MDYEWKFLSVIRKAFLGTPYILYIRAKWLFSPCGRFFLFFCLDTKEKETKRKNQGYVSGPTPERPAFFLRQGASLLAFSFLMLFYDLLSLVWNLLKYIALKILSSRTEFSILRLSIYILNLSLYILKLSFYILSLSIELLWWRE